LRPRRPRRAVTDVGRFFDLRRLEGPVARNATRTLPVVEPCLDLLSAVRAVAAGIFGRHADERREAVVSIADEFGVIDLTVFEDLVVRRSAASTVVETDVDALTAVRAVHARSFAADADERLERILAVSAVADVDRALDLRGFEHPVAIVVDAHSKPLPAVRAIAPWRFGARLNQRVLAGLALFAVFAVFAVLAIDPIFARIALFAILTVVASFTVRAIDDDPFGAVGARNRDEPFALHDRTRIALRPPCAVFTAAPRNHHDEPSQRRPQDKTTPNPVPKSHGALPCSCPSDRPGRLEELQRRNIFSVTRRCKGS
jgi:hypothetical protein